MNRAAFLDRDGVINRKAREGEYVTRWEEMQILPGVAEAIGRLNGSGFRVIVVSNQRCVAKGLISVADLEALHQQMCQALVSAGARIDAIYYCPHDVQPPCRCRKPGPGMLLDAACAHGIDLKASWMIGDSEIDVEAGQSAGCRTARLLNDEAADGNADVVAPSLLEAIHQILLREESPTNGKRPSQKGDQEVEARGFPSPVKTATTSTMVEATTAEESAGNLSRAVRDLYRCPQDFLDFALSGQLSSERGFFRFGPRATCYGRSSLGTRAPGADLPLYDTLQHVLSRDAKVRLPFDPTEIIDNLRLELYAERPSKGTYVQNVLRKIYYLVRPLLSLSVRRQIQKFHALNWRQFCFPHWPVDTTIENICETLMSLSLEAKGMESVPFVWFWPKGARGCVLMTHDVETTAGRDFCVELMDINDSFGIKSSFQIVPEERYVVSPEFLDTIRTRGFEVVIHDLNHDGQLFGMKEEFLRRAAMINRYAAQYRARGFRAGVLYRKPEWYEALEFSFDMSFPNVAPLDPQRGGCCTVMPYFIGDMLELPLTTTQDYTLFHLLNERSLDLWKAQVELILEKSGLVSFIIHPDYVIDSDTKAVYRDLLAYLRDLRSERELWCALPSDVDRWWRARSKMSVVKDGDSWRIEGEGAERAVLAYAKRVDGKLVYEFKGSAPAE